MKVINQLNVVLIIVAILVVGYASGLLPVNRHDHMMTMHGDMDHMRDDYLVIKQAMTSDMLSHGDYACCLDTPCAYCLEKTPGHGEGATCTCLEDVMNGRHPCGECIGEIMEGHGNKFLAPYFAKSIAEEVGEQHLDTMKQIVAEKYGTLIEDQI